MLTCHTLPGGVNVGIPQRETLGVLYSHSLPCVADLRQNLTAEGAGGLHVHIASSEGATYVDLALLIGCRISAESMSVSLAPSPGCKGFMSSYTRMITLGVSVGSCRL